jgi:hypothetical protein
MRGVVPLRGFMALCFRNTVAPLPCVEELCELPSEERQPLSDCRDNGDLGRSWPVRSNTGRKEGHGSASRPLERSLSALNTPPPPIHRFSVLYTVTLIYLLRFR